MDQKYFFFKMLGLGDPEAETAKLAKQHNVDHNALAHAYTMAKVLHKYGPKFAEQLGLSNEIGSNFIASWKGTQNTRYPDAFGHLWNNEIGRQIAEFGNANGLNFKELEPFLIDAVRRGRTINDKSSDPRVPSFAPVYRSDGTFVRPNPVWEYYQHHADKPRWIAPNRTEPNFRRPAPDGHGGGLGVRQSRQTGGGLQNPIEAYPSQRLPLALASPGRVFVDPSRAHQRFFRMTPAQGTVWQSRWNGRSAMGSGEAKSSTRRSGGLLSHHLR